MRRSMLSLSVALGVAVVATAWLAASTASGKSKSAPVLSTMDELKWAAAPDAEGIQEAVLWGDPGKGAYGAIDRFKAGLNLPLHTHSSESRGVVISGTLVLTLEGKEPKELGPGSYLLVPGNLRHVTACEEGEDCVVFVQQPGKSDFNPVEQAGSGK